MPPTSWLVYHGTSFHSALCAIGQNSLNKSESDKGRPAPGDAKAQEVYPEKVLEMASRYETASGRGVYCAQDWGKALAYALPFNGPESSRLTVRIVFLLRVPGALEDVGVSM